MTRTIVKTAAMLKVRGHPSSTLYGDVHVVGNCAVIDFPQQSDYPAIDGFITLEDSYFLRHSTPYSVLVIPAQMIEWGPGVLHPLDQAKWDAALKAGEPQ